MLFKHYCRVHGEWKESSTPAGWTVIPARLVGVDFPARQVLVHVPASPPPTILPTLHTYMTRHHTYRPTTRWWLASNWALIFLSGRYLPPTFLPTFLPTILARLRSWWLALRNPLEAFLCTHTEKAQPGHGYGVREGLGFVFPCDHALLLTPARCRCARQCNLCCLLKFLARFATRRRKDPFVRSLARSGREMRLR